MTNLGIPLQKMPTEPATKMSIVNGLWLRRPSVRLQLDDLDWEAYFSYYYEQCKALRRISATTHQDIVDTTRYLEQLPSKSAIKQELRNQLPTSKLNDDQDELLEGSIILATRLFVMMDIGVPRLAFSGRPPLVWNDGDLKTFIHDYFNEPPMLGHEGIRLEPIFVARNLERVAGITIEWTSNLADHLRMTGDGDKTVAIFHHASFLRWNQSSIFPEGLIDETLDTLALLFPTSDKKCDKWYQRLSRSLPAPLVLDRKATKCGRLRSEKRQIEHFKFWHDRLVILKQEFDQSNPATIQQWWVDRRNGVQWYTFWVAVMVIFLTIFFGMIQSILGVIQVYKAYYPARL